MALSGSVTDTETLNGVRLQSNTTNTVIQNPIIQTGWKVIAGSVSGVLTDSVTYPITYSTAPIIVAVFGGDNIGGAATYGAGGANRNNAFAEAFSVTVSGFSVRIVSSPSSNWAVGDNIFYQWIAIGY